MALRSFRSSNAEAQNFRCRISLSRGSTSYSTSRRSMVARCALTMASATRCAEFGDLAFAGFDGVQRGAAPGQGIGMVLVIARRVRVEIPAVVIEAHGGVGEQRLHVGERLLFQVVEAHHDVGHLHAGVVDVVLHLDALAAGAQHAHEGVAERRVAQVADVGRLVGIDVGVLDDDLPVGAVRRRWLGRASGRRHRRRGRAGY